MFQLKKQNIVWIFTKHDPDNAFTELIQFADTTGSYIGLDVNGGEEKRPWAAFLNDVKWWFDL